MQLVADVDEEECLGESRLVRSPTFDGTAKSFTLWWLRFRACAAVYKFILALSGADQTELPAREDTVLDKTDPAELLKINARRRNEVAMANFAMSFVSEATMGVIIQAISDEWPSGKASVVVTLLMKKCKPQDAMTRVELRQAMNKIKMKSNKDPATLFEQISAAENRHESASAAGLTKVELEDVIAVILDAAVAYTHLRAHETPEHLVCRLLPEKKKK